LEIPKFERFFRILIQNAYVSNQFRLTQSFSENAEARYLSLLDKQPTIFQRAPQYLIASYLGIKKKRKHESEKIFRPYGNNAINLRRNETTAIKKSE